MQRMPQQQSVDAEPEAAAASAATAVGAKLSSV